MAGAASPAMLTLEATRRELEAMEYFEYLGMESLELVRKLLADLVMTTESHESQQERIQSLEKEVKLAQEDALGLRKENSRLVRENNQLHLEMIARAEELDAKERDLMAQVRDAKDELAKVDFLKDQFKKRMEEAEEQLSRSRDDTDGHEAGSRALTDTMKKYGSTAGSDRKAEEMQEKLRKVTREASELKESLDHMTKQVELREAEVERLQSELEQASGIQVKKLSPPSHASIPDENLVAELYDQIDFLNAKVSEKEKKLQRAKIDEQLFAQTRVELKRKEKELQAALMELGRGPSGDKENQGGEFNSDISTKGGDSAELQALLEAYNDDKKRYTTIIEGLEGQVMEFRSRCNTLQRSLEEKIATTARLEDEVRKLTSEKSKAKEEAQDAERSMARIHSARLGSEENRAAASAEVQSLERIIEEQRAETNGLRQELDEVRRNKTNFEQELLLARGQLQELEVDNEQLRDQLRRANAAKETLDNEKKALQTQVDRLSSDSRQANLKAQDMRAEAQEAKAEAERSLGRCRILEDEVRTLTQQLVAKAEEVYKEAGARAELQHLADLPGVVQALEEQVSRWRSRAADLDTESRRVSRALENANMEKRDVTKQRDSLEHALSELRSEYEDLSGKLRVNEASREELEFKLQEVASARDHFEAQAKNAAEQLRSRTTNEVNQEAEFNRLQIVIKTTKTKLEAAIRREKYLQEQLDVARETQTRTSTEKLETSSGLEAAKAETGKLKETIDSLENEVRRLRREELKASDALQIAEEKLREVTEQLDTDKTEKAKLNAHLEQFKNVFSKLDETRANLQERVKELHTALQKEKNSNEELGKKCKALEELARSISEKNSHLERSVKDVNEQKHILMSKVEAKGQQIDELERAIKKQETAYRALEKQLGAARRQLHTQAETLNARDSDMATLEEDLKSAKQMISQIEKIANARQNELNAASQDLSNMTRETQAVNASCQSLRVERDRFRLELSQALARASRLEGLLESCKLEKADVLSVYGRVCDEKRRLERLVKELSTSRANFVGENQAQQVDMSRIRQRLAESEEVCRKQQVDLQASERQLAELSRQLHSFQGRMEIYEEEKSVAERSANDAKETTQNLAYREQSLSWEISQQHSEIEKLTHRVKKLQGERDALESKLFQERRKVAEMEMVAVKERRKRAEAVMSADAKTIELHQLKESLLENEIQAEALMNRGFGTPLSHPKDDIDLHQRSQSVSELDEQSFKGERERELRHDSPTQRTPPQHGREIDEHEPATPPSMAGFSTEAQKEKAQDSKGSVKARQGPKKSPMRRPPSPVASGSGNSSSSGNLESEIQNMISSQDDVIEGIKRDREMIKQVASQTKEEVTHHSRMLRGALSSFEISHDEDNQGRSDANPKKQLFHSENDDSRQEQEERDSGEDADNHGNEESF